MFKEEVEETLVYTNEEDEDKEDVVVADGPVDVKVEAQPLRPELAHNALTVVSMDITLHNVQELQVHQAVVVLHSLSISAVILHPESQEIGMDEEEIVEAVATDALLFFRSECCI